MRFIRYFDTRILFIKDDKKSKYQQPSVGDAGAPIFRLIPARDLHVEGGPSERVGNCDEQKLIIRVLFFKNFNVSLVGLSIEIKKIMKRFLKFGWNMQ